MSANGIWNLTMNTPMGEQKSVLIVNDDGATMQSPDGVQEPVENYSRNGDTLKWKVSVKKPIPIGLHFDVTVEGDVLTGKFRPGMFPQSPVSGVRA